MATKKEEDFYVVFGVARDATPDEIRKAYYKLALKYHPDRIQGHEGFLVLWSDFKEINEEKKTDKEKANAEFQRIGRMYEVLSDPDRRELYNQTGMVDDDFLTGSEGRDWAAYWRLLFKKVNVTTYTLQQHQFGPTKFSLDYGRGYQSLRAYL